ncbi:hypothetical protein HZA97_05145 [Candidatus Woesearchaeota archaeon]|nr:hypothetical protein [Candidatus Woesearchaeota archaeon]
MPPIMYNIVSFCKLCRKRMVQPKGATTWYCQACEQLIKKSQAKEAREQKRTTDKDKVSEDEGQKNKRKPESKKSVLRKKTSRKRK